MFFLSNTVRWRIFKGKWQVHTNRNSTHTNALNLNGSHIHNRTHFLAYRWSRTLHTHWSCSVCLFSPHSTRMKKKLKDEQRKKQQTRRITIESRIVMMVIGASSLTSNYADRVCVYVLILTGVLFHFSLSFTLIPCTALNKNSRVFIN